VTGPSGAATRELWARLARPVDAQAGLGALFGLEPGPAALAVAVGLAGAPETERLLADLHDLSRGLATRVATVHERCAGEIRGPILWSETNAARASSNGATDVFVCEISRRVTDTAENRIVVAGLLAVVRAGLAVEASDDLPAALRDERDRVVAAGREAETWLVSPAFAAVDRARPGSRDLHRARNGQRRSRYGTALALFQRVAQPVTPALIDRLLDPATAAEHAALLATIANEPSARGGPIVLVDGEARIGPIRYRHGTRPGPPAG